MARFCKPFTRAKVNYFDASESDLALAWLREDSILRYETALRADNFVLLIHGTPEETTQAQGILRRIKSETLDHHQL